MLPDTLYSIESFVRFSFQVFEFNDAIDYISSIKSFLPKPAGLSLSAMPRPIKRPAARPAATTSSARQAAGQLVSSDIISAAMEIADKRSKRGRASAVCDLLSCSS